MSRENARLTTSYVAAVILALGVSQALAQPAPQKLPDPMDFGIFYQQFAFEAADTDGNNLVSEAEFVRDAAVAFSDLDTNHDGKLTPQELGTHDSSKFARIDANNDGVLTFSEIMTFKMKAFREADTNYDDALSYDEMVKSVMAEEKK
ncbi:MAG: EF-hand domain-containing protein [Rhodospirillales bacterium]